MGRFGMGVAATAVTLIVLTLGNAVERYVDRQWPSAPGEEVKDSGAGPSE